MVEQLLEELSALEQVEAVALGGSRAGAVYDAHSDYDVYLYCTSPVPEEVRREILSRYCGHMELGNSYWEYEDNCVLHGGVEMDILYRDLDDFTAGVAAVVEQHRAANGYTTCMWHNLRTCRILRDKKGRLQAAKERFAVPYPPALKENIIRRNRNLLCDAMPAYRGQILKAVGRGDQVSIAHRTAAFMESYFDILWAVNEKTHPGEKRLVELCKKECALLPEGFEENLARLYADLFAAPQRVEEDLARIIAALKKLLEEEHI